jgi:5-methylcytosine-specific restriction endonuclease McrA
MDEVSITLATGGPEGPKEVSMSRVFVIETNHQPLDPLHAGHARLLLKAEQAAGYRRFPFTLILKRAVARPTLPPVRLKSDPGRQRQTRYRQPRFSKRRRRTGQLPPCLESRLCPVLTWVRRLIRLCPVSAISQERVRLDTQALENPAIEGVEYQQGQLVGCEVREYVRFKWKHRCASCDARGVPLELDHIQPHSTHGTHRVSNLTLAPHACNRRKGDQDIRAFREEPERLARVLAQVKTPLLHHHDKAGHRARNSSPGLPARRTERWIYLLPRKGAGVSSRRVNAGVSPRPIF